MTTLQRLPVRVWTHSDLRALKWGSILFGVGVGLFMPRGLRRYGRFIALGVAAFAIKPLMVLLREDSLITGDRPLHGEESSEGFGAETPTDFEVADARLE
jgi:hypothetical protein